MILTDRYTNMRARASLYADNANWAYIGIVMAALWFGFIIIFQIIFGLWAGLQTVQDNPDVVDAFFLGSTPAAVRWTLATFAIYTALLLGMMRLVHNLRLRALIGPTRTAINEFIKVTLYLSPIYAFLIIPSLFLPEAQRQFTTTTWLSMLPVMLPLLFVQISAEEFVFRGYLQSHMAALTSHPIIWMGVPSFPVRDDPFRPHRRSLCRVILCDLGHSTWAGLRGPHGTIRNALHRTCSSFHQ